MKNIKNCLASALVLAIVGTAISQIAKSSQLEAATTGNLDVYSSNSRLSFLGRLDSTEATNNEEGTSRYIIQTQFSEYHQVYSTSSAMLQPGDKLYIGEDTTNYKIMAHTNVNPPANEIPLTTALSEEEAEAAQDSAVIFSPMVTELKLTFDGAASSQAGVFRFLVPAGSDGDNLEQYSDGIPDVGSYDFGDTATTTIQCPTIGSTPLTGTATPASTANVRFGNTYYHVFECPYAADVMDSNKEELTAVIRGVINPAPMPHTEEEELNRSVGSMDIYGIRYEQVDASNNYLNNGNVYVGVGNAVKMMVRVMPQLTFKITGMADNDIDVAGNTFGTDICGIGKDADVLDSTGVEVKFGEISNTAFKYAVQRMTVTTNATHGYVITAIANDQMAFNGQTCEGKATNLPYCIPGTPTPEGSSDDTTITPVEWTTGRGFGYTMQVMEGDDYLNTPGTPNVQTIFDTPDTWRAFADRQAGEEPIQVVNNLRSTQKDVIDVCYKIMSDSTNIPGDYESRLTYTITATF